METSVQKNSFHYQVALSVDKIDALGWDGWSTLGGTPNFIEAVLSEPEQHVILPNSTDSLGNQYNT